MRWLPVLLVGLLLVPAMPLGELAAAQEAREVSANAQTNAVAVARTESGDLRGTVATISVSVSTGGDGSVYLDTRPLTGTDMQGSARISARVAASLTGYAMEEHDFYFVVRSDSPVISGPSAGSVMTLAATVALKNAHQSPGEEAWNISEEVLVTGTINPDGSIGPVGGILQKAQAAARQGASLFLVPEGQGVLEARSSTGQQRGERVDVAEHCEQQLGITCREVGDIRELVRLATGHRFVEGELGDPPTTASYEETLAPLADDLIDRGRTYEEVWARLNESDVADPAAREIVSVLREARAGVDRAEANVAEERFYSAASRAFVAAIQARHAEFLLAFHQQGRSSEVVTSAIEQAREEADRAREAAGDANVTGMQDLYVVGAAQQRVSDAEDHARRAERAWNASEGADPNRALAFAARAIERSATVHWWLHLGDAFGPGPELPVPVDQLADEMMDLAGEMLVYTTEILRNQQPEQASDAMRQARENDRRGFHAGAAVEAAEVQVISALSVELRAGRLTEDKLDAARDSATRAIQEARGLGVEPILPIALFEFGGVQEEPGAELRFYRTASVLAGMSQTLETGGDPTPTEHVGGWEGEDHGPPVGHTYRSVAAGWFAVGLFATFALAIFAAAFTRSSSRP